MAKASPVAILQLQIQKMIGFLNFTMVFLRKKNPVKACIKGTIEYVNELLTINKKLQRIQKAIMVEKYKYKKTELILAQNQEHFFLSGRSIDQTR